MKAFVTSTKLLKHVIFFTTLAVVMAVVNVASAATIQLVNQGFETDDLSGWTSIGQVSVVGVANVTTSNGTNYQIAPNDTRMAFLDSFGVGVDEIESFFGVTSGSLYATVNTSGNHQSLTNGSAIYQSFTASAGDTIDMSWNYVARDYVPFTDPSFAVLVAPDGTASINVLASTTGPGLVTGSDGISGVFTFAQALTQTGEYKLGFAVTNSGDTILDAALFLDNGASSCFPNCNDPGTPENPFLPLDDDTPGSFDFSFTVTTPTIPIFIDPIIAVGYTYEVNSGPNVASVLLPNIGDGIYQIYGWDGTAFNNFFGNAFANIPFFFSGAGVNMFQVLGIETLAMLDPTNPTAFVTGLTFASAGDVDISQIPVTLDYNPNPNPVPEPGTMTLFSLGLIGACLARRRSQHKSVRG